MKSNKLGFSLKILLPIATIGILAACGGGGSQPNPTYSPSTKLNDTGVVDLDSSVPSTHHDALHGRDFSAMQGVLSKVGASTPNNGITNGFDYTKTGHTGAPLAIQNAAWRSTGNEAAGTQWDCVKDNVTGLFWENKTDKTTPDLHDKDWVYSWYKSSATQDVGTADAGRCHASGRCDTEKYVADVNAAGLCGFSNWRLPSHDELHGLLDYGRSGIVIDTGFFPNTSAASYWSSTTYAARGVDAWLVDFGTGQDGVEGKGVSRPVRLVRSQ